MSHVATSDKSNQQTNLINQSQRFANNIDDIEALLDEIEVAEQKYDDKQKHEDKHETYDEIDDTSSFLDDLVIKLKEGNIGWIKDILRRRTINIDECNDQGQTLLMLATRHGLYELVSICLNLGADIDKEDNNKNTALKIAKQQGYHDIEQLLLMNLLKSRNEMEKMENTTNDLLLKQHITNNFNTILHGLFEEKIDDEKIDDENKDHQDILEVNTMMKKEITSAFLTDISASHKKQLVNTMMSIILESIKHRIAFSDDMLFICFHFEIQFYIKPLKKLFQKY
eukprot:128097_1